MSSQYIYQQEKVQGISSPLTRLYYAVNWFKDEQEMKNHTCQTFGTDLSFEIYEDRSGTAAKPPQILTAHRALQTAHSTKCLNQ